MAFDFSRFEYKVDDALLQTVLDELNQGKKKTHWIWFIFPQLRAPNQSETSRYFALRNLDEASDFLQHEVLGPRLIECTQAVVQHQDRTAVEIFGEVDAKKFHRCMTLFSSVPEADPVFEQALEIFFNDGEGYGKKIEGREGIIQ